MVDKYLKYKNKYLEQKELNGGSMISEISAILKLIYNKENSISAADKLRIFKEINNIIDIKQNIDSSKLLNNIKTLGEKNANLKGLLDKFTDDEIKTILEI